jgi:hypothetical protein
MTAIRVIFDGKAFIPQQTIALEPQSEALVLIDGTDCVSRDQSDQIVRAYYQCGVDADDDDWGRAAEVESQRAWDED